MAPFIRCFVFERDFLEDIVKAYPDNTFLRKQAFSGSYLRWFLLDHLKKRQEMHWGALQVWNSFPSDSEKLKSHIIGAQNAWASSTLFGHLKWKLYTWVVSYQQTQFCSQSSSDCIGSLPCPKQCWSHQSRPDLTRTGHRAVFEDPSWSWLGWLYQTEFDVVSLSRAEHKASSTWAVSPSQTDNSFLLLSLSRIQQQHWTQPASKQTLEAFEVI